MFAPKPRIEIATRILLIAVVLFNAFAPVTAYASSQSGADQSSIAGTDGESPRSLVEPKPLYYYPPQTVQTQKRSPEGDKPVSPIPPMDAVEFTLVADPAVVPTDGLVQFNAYMRNNTEREIVGLTFTDSLETGLEYRPSTASPFTYDSENLQVVLVLS